MAYAISLAPQIEILDTKRREDILTGLQQAMQGIKPEGIERAPGRSTRRSKPCSKSTTCRGLPGARLSMQNM